MALGGSARRATPCDFAGPLHRCSKPGMGLKTCSSRPSGEMTFQQPIGVGTATGSSGSSFLTVASTACEDVAWRSQHMCSSLLPSMMPRACRVRLFGPRRPLIVAPAAHVEGGPETLSTVPPNAKRNRTHRRLLLHITSVNHRPRVFPKSVYRHGAAIVLPYWSPVLRVRGQWVHGPEHRHR